VGVNPLIVADIGGTYARFGVATSRAGGTLIDRKYQLPCADFKDFESAFAIYRDELHVSDVRQACVAVAGPVVEGSVSLTNLDWHISGQKMRQTFGLDRFEVVNDFAAVASAVMHLTSDDLCTIAPGTKRENAPIAIIGPGTGLGVAAILPIKGEWVVVPSEGGHASLASTGPLETEIISRIGGGFEVSAETLLSGAGILRIYDALCAVHGEVIAFNAPEQITEAAVAGSDELAVTTIDVFCRLLGGLVGNVALTYGATGGVCLAGGILPEIRDFLIESQFVTCMKNKGAMSKYLESLPVELIMTPNAGLIGAASWLKSH
jgi:glucokinase